MSVTTSVCVKVANLRKLGYSSLEDWMRQPRHLYVGRNGRVFITENGARRVFCYGRSKWANPYVVGEGPRKYTREQSVTLYHVHLYDSGLIAELEELHGLVLGCFCDANEPCHARLLVNLIRTSFLVRQSEL